MNEIEVAKNIIPGELKENGSKPEKIILFGSRTRENFDKDSDWDFYIIVNKEMSFSQKRKINTKIRRKLAELKIPNDLIIQSKTISNARENNVGYLTHYILKEGKVI